MPPHSPEGLRHLLSSLSACPPGKGNVVSPSPSQDALDLFATCAAHGWAEEVRCGSVRVWKITPRGRAALFPPLFPFQTVVAEC